MTVQIKVSKNRPWDPVTRGPHLHADGEGEVLGELAQDLDQKLPHRGLHLVRLGPGGERNETQRW